MRVLVVDDEPAFSEPLAERLALRGYETATAQDADAALAELARGPRDLIFLDVGLPGMDGVDLLKILREHYPLTDVVMLSGAGDMGKAVQAMRRGALNTTMKEHGCNKLALGHHFDDAVETFMMSLVFEGRLNCFKPVTYMSRADVTQIRPLLYIGEQRSANLAGQLELPVVKSTCPMDHTSKRQEIKDLLTTLSAQYPDVRSKVFGAMQRLPLDGWGPTPHERVKTRERKKEE